MMRSALFASLALFACASAWQLPLAAVPPASVARLRTPLTACAPPPEPAPIASYEDAEIRGFELYKQGEYERAIRMFELAQTLPGAGMDYTREKSSGMIGSATAPPNPRGLKKERFATPQQKLIAQVFSSLAPPIFPICHTPFSPYITLLFLTAQYNIACCHGARGDKPQAMEIVRTYLSQVREPLDQLNEMIADGDMVPIREELRGLREVMQRERQKGAGALFGFLPKLDMRELADKVGVEWKD